MVKLLGSNVGLTEIFVRIFEKDANIDQFEKLHINNNDKLLI